jgi:hypothetical protein
MKCDSWASLLARTFASHYFGREPKAKVTIIMVIFLVLILFLVFLNFFQGVAPFLGATLDESKPPFL